MRPRSIFIRFFFLALPTALISGCLSTDDAVLDSTSSNPDAIQKIYFCVQENVSQSVYEKLSDDVSLGLIVAGKYGKFGTDTVWQNKTFIYGVFSYQRASGVNKSVARSMQVEVDDGSMTVSEPELQKYYDPEKSCFIAELANEQMSSDDVELIGLTRRGKEYFMPYSYYDSSSNYQVFKFRTALSEWKGEKPAVVTCSYCSLSASDSILGLENRVSVTLADGKKALVLPDLKLNLPISRKPDEFEDLGDRVRFNVVSTEANTEKVEMNPQKRFLAASAWDHKMNTTQIAQKKHADEICEFAGFKESLDSKVDYQRFFSCALGGAYSSSVSVEDCNRYGSSVNQLSRADLMQTIGGVEDGSPKLITTLQRDDYLSYSNKIYGWSRFRSITCQKDPAQAVTSSLNKILNEKLNAQATDLVTVLPGLDGADGISGMLAFDGVELNSKTLFFADEASRRAQQFCQIFSTSPGLEGFSGEVLGFSLQSNPFNEIAVFGVDSAFSFNLGNALYLYLNPNASPGNELGLSVANAITTDAILPKEWAASGFPKGLAGHFPVLFSSLSCKRR